MLSRHDTLPISLGTKGARLSTQISIAGRMLVYLPYDPHVGISQKIESEEDRIALRERVLQFRGDDKGGFIVRTQAEGATDEELQGDHTYLRTLWNSIQEKAKSQPTPSVLYTDLTLAQRVLRDMVGPHTVTIQVDSSSTTAQLAR